MIFFDAKIFTSEPPAGNLLEAALGTRPVVVISLVFELNNISVKLPEVNALMRGDPGSWCDDKLILGCCFFSKETLIKIINHMACDTTQ